MHWSYLTPSSDNTRDDSTHGHHQMVNTEIRLIIFFAAKDGEALHSQQEQSWLWLRSWAPYCQTQTSGEGSRENNQAIQVWPQSSPSRLYSGRDRSKGLDLINRVPEELWKEVRHVQESVIKTIPNKKIFKNAKWLFEKDLQIAEKRREVKDKGEKERYNCLHAVSKNNFIYLHY